LWLIQRERMQADPDFFKTIRIGRSSYKRYSGKCYQTLRARLAEIDLNALWGNRIAPPSTALRDASAG